MSVKFQEEITRSQVGGQVGSKTPLEGLAAGQHGKHELLHDVGSALTKGGGPNGYLAAYIRQLQSNPLRTKVLTSGTLAGLQELMASWIAHDKNQYGNYFTSRVPKMALYGAFISAPLGHVLIAMLQRVFQNRTSVKAKILQILTSNLIVSPIQNVVYLIFMAIIAGARTIHQVRATVRAGFWPVMRVSWITSPVCLAFAQAFLPQEAWVPFFNFVAFVIGTYINAHTKKKRLAALRRKHYGDGRGGSGSVSGRDYKDEGYGGPGVGPSARPGY